MEKIEIVLSGLILDGDVSRQGQIYDKPDGVPDTPQEQLDKWGKIHYVVIGSSYDNEELKTKLKAQENDVTALMRVELPPSISPEGLDILGLDADEGVKREDLDSLGDQPPPFDGLNADNDEEAKSVENNSEGAEGAAEGDTTEQAEKSAEKTKKGAKKAPKKKAAPKKNTK